MKVQTRNIARVVTAVAVAAISVVVSMVSGTAFAATERKAPKEIEIKVEPMQQTDDESVKRQVERMSAVNKALEQALDEAAKSQSAFERHNDRLASRPEISDADAPEARGQVTRDNREDQRREKRLNWLND